MTIPAVMMSTAFALVASWFFYSRLTHPAVLGWLALKIAIAGIRVLHRIWHTQRGHGFDHLARQRQSGWLLFADGLVWGLGGLVALAGQDSLTLMASISLVGVATMGAFALQAHWPYVVAYCVPVLVPAILVTLLERDPFGLFVGMGLSTLTLCLLGAARLAQNRIGEMLYLRFTNAQLAQERTAALNLAQQQIEEKSLFVATMSHELRTPLHGILGLTRMLQSSSLAGQDRDNLALVERSGEHLLTVINNILDFSRIEAGHLETEHKAFDLCTLLSDVVALNAVTAQAKGLSLQADIDLPASCVVMGDAARLRQILLNLVGNAVKFTHQGWIRVSVSRPAASADGAAPLVFHITDTGVGIAPQDMAHIFAPFKQAEAPAHQRLDGSGLGLTIARAMAHAMNGEVSCTSVLGQGSTFELTLPLPPAIAAATPVATAAIAQPSSETRPSSVRTVPLQGRVILAEDNDVNAMIVEALLRRHGLEVEHQPDGNAVIQAVCNNGIRPDLILMDCLMPMLDGFEATRLIRTDEQTRGLPRIPIVALTASALSEDSARCMAAGMDGYLSKPFTEDQLVSMLNTFLPVSSSPTQAAALNAA
ncbi:MAG: response regulator [Burkholderiales bacterium]|nr:response regulator [Burkholderiales bacterium]